MTLAATVRAAAARFGDAAGVRRPRRVAAQLRRARRALRRGGGRARRDGHRPRRRGAAAPAVGQRLRGRLRGRRQGRRRHGRGEPAARRARAAGGGEGGRRRAQPDEPPTTWRRCGAPARRPPPSRRPTATCRSHSCSPPARPASPRARCSAARQLAAITRIDVADAWGDPAAAATPMLAGTQFAHVGFMTKLPWYLRLGTTTHILGPLAGRRRAGLHRRAPHPLHRRRRPAGGAAPARATSRPTTSTACRP